MTRVEFGRIKKDDVLFNQQYGLYRVVDFEAVNNRTRKCVAHSTTPSELNKVAIDETQCSLWAIHR